MTRRGSGPNWLPLGPAAIPQGTASGNPVVSGRITGLAVGPGGTRIYAGTANGGVWRSEDAGATWAPLEEYAVSPNYVSGLDADSLAVGALAVQFGASRAADKIFVGTGEANFSSRAYFGIGIKYSTNGGETFNLEAPNAATAKIYKIIIDPDDPKIVVAATTRGLYTRPSVTGPLPPGDASRWPRIAMGDQTPDRRPIEPPGQVTDVIVAGHAPNKAYYFALQAVSPASVYINGVYRSADATFRNVFPMLAASPGRIALAASESDPPVIYALGSNGALYRAISATDGVFRRVLGVPPDLGVSNYALAIAVDPQDPNTIYLAGTGVAAANNTNDLALYKCTVLHPEGAMPHLQSTFFGTGVHPDAHCLVFATKADGRHDPNIIWAGTDGGLFCYMPGPGSDLATFSKTSRSNFRARNIGLNITQLTYLDHRPDTDAVVHAGSQDNGTIRYIGEPSWSEAPHGDGGGIAVDPNNPMQVMCQSLRGVLSRSIDGGRTWSRLRFLDGAPASRQFPLQPTAGQIESDSIPNYVPLKACAQGPNRTLVALGTYRLWLTADWGDTWVTLPSGTDPSTDLAQDRLDGDVVKAISFGAARQIFVATAGNVWSFVHYGSTWFKRKLPQIPGMIRDPNTQQVLTPISALCAEFPTTEGLYVGLGGRGIDHVWYWDPKAQQWISAGDTGLTKAELDVPVNAIVADWANPDRSPDVYIGSNIGVWKATKGGLLGPWNWSLFSDGLPECAVVDLAIHDSGRLLRAATYGRGAWEISLGTTPDPDPDIYVRANYADSGRVTASGRQPWVDTVPDPAMPSATATHFQSADIKVNPASQARFYVAEQQLPVKSFMPPFDHVDFAQLSATARTIEASGTNQIIIQVHNRSPVAFPGTAFVGSQVKVLLLLANMTGNSIPQLPANYADKVAGQSKDDWLGASGWKFADATNRYRTLPGNVSAYSPQIVTYDVDLWPMGLYAGPQVCAAIFVIKLDAQGAAEPLTATTPDIGQLTIKDKHVACRVLQVVATPTGMLIGGVSLPRFGHTATVLADGRVLITGGVLDGYTKTTTIFDPVRSEWTAGPGTNTARVQHAAVRLADGRVLVVGGLEHPETAEIFDPRANPNQWTSIPSMNFRRVYPAISLLPDGTVLVAGGGSAEYAGSNNPCEIFDPSNKTSPWSVLPNRTLPDGRQQAVVPYGTSGLVFVFPSCQIFDPALRTLTPTRSPQSPFYETAFSTTALPTGEVLVTGAKVNEMEPSDPTYGLSFIRTMTCELFTPARNAWRTMRTKFPPRYLHTATLLADGRVLFAAGITNPSQEPIRSTLIYDPARCVWTQSPALACDRSGPVAALLPDGRVLIVGGDVGSAEVYTPPANSVVLYGST